MILAIETSAAVCSVALCSDTGMIKEYESNAPMQHAALIGTYVDKILRETNAEISLIAVAIGPGSFTGLRIGMSYAQGFCFGRNINIVGVSNHQILASFCTNPAEDNFSIIDANRNELYLAKHVNNETFEIMSHKIIAQKDLANETSENAHILCYDSLELSQNFTSIRTITKVPYKAARIAKIGKVIVDKRGPDKIDNLEPMYIRPFAGVK